MPSIADLFITVSSDVSGALQGLTDVDTAVNGTSASMAAAAPAALALAGAATAVGGAFLDSITTAANFEQHISNIKALLSPDEANTYGAAIENLAQELGKDTVFSADQAANAIAELVRAGVPIVDVLNGGAAAALNLATATGINVSDAATLAGQTLTTFGLTADDLGKKGGVVDILAGVANTTAATMDSLRLGFSDVGSTAHQMGLSFEDTATAIGILNQNGETANTAGTALKMVLEGLIPTTAKQNEVFTQLGLTTADGTNKFFDASGQVKSLADITQILHDATAGMSDEQAALTLRVLFGTQGMQAAAIMMGYTSDQVKELQANIEGISAADAAKIRLDNLNGALTNLDGSVETAKIQIGDLFLPVLTQAAEALTVLVNAFIALDPSVQATIVSVVGITAAAAALLAGFILLGPVIASVGAAFGIILGAIAAVSGPLLALAAAAALLYAAWQDDFGGIQEVTAQVWANVQPALANIQTFVTLLADTLAPAFQNVASAAGPFIQQLSTQLAPLLAQLPDAVKQAGDEFNNLGVFIGRVSDAIGFLVTGNLNSFIDLAASGVSPQFLQTLIGIHDAFNAIGPVVEMVAQAINFLITGNLDRLYELMQEGLPQQFAASLQFVHDVLATQIEIIATIIGGFNEFIGLVASGDLEGAFNSLVNTFSKLQDLILPLWNEFLTVLGNLLSGLPQFIADRAGNIWAGLGTAFANLADNVRPGWDYFTGWLATQLGFLPGFIAGNLGDIWAGLGQAFAGLADAMKPGWEYFTGWLGTQLGFLPGFIAGNMGDVWAGLAVAFGGLADYLKPGWEYFTNWLGTQLNFLPGFVGGEMGDVFNGLATAFSGLADYLSPAWDAFAQWFGTVLSGLPQFVGDNMGDVFSALGAAFSGLVDYLSPAWDAFAQWFGSIISYLPQFVIDNVGDIFGGIVQQATDLITRISDAIQPLGNLLGGTFGQFLAWVTGGGVVSVGGGTTGGTTTTGGGGNTFNGPIVQINNPLISDQLDVNTLGQDIANLVIQALVSTEQQATVPA